MSLGVRGASRRLSRTCSARTQPPPRLPPARAQELTGHQRAVRGLAADVAQREEDAVLGRQRRARVRQLALERLHDVLGRVDQSRRDHFVFVALPGSLWFSLLGVCVSGNASVVHERLRD